MFWTNRAHPDNVWADTVHGRATMKVADVILPDFHDTIAALQHKPPVAIGTLSMNVTWKGGGKLERVDDDEKDVGGTVVQGPASVWFHVESDDGFSYTSDRHGQKTLVAEVRSERNGVFHH
ncbi:hypothetical protein E0H75_21325 [Kribbella capetownensis]|uniref:Uncharacterized protein n=1 Tax=Kribbella capetownensis TaxID=1572659 RepID=A0A4V2M7U8_9ACTN|nr:hypothetical protein [Kribbella capetownensis]TCC49082.1 hypothetical protein E0H75_21325 [Kribbella capetownensis]